MKLARTTTLRSSSSCRAFGQCRARKHTVVKVVNQIMQSAAPDLILDGPNGWKVHVLGATHMQRQEHIGRYILDRKPAAVLTETSLTPEQGAVPGGTVSCQSQVQGPAAFWVRMFCAVGAELEKQGAAAFEPGGVWHGLQQNYHGEQLAYIAAFALNKPLVFLDRPKDLTYKRLWALTSMVELDEGFAKQSARNYCSILKSCGAAAPTLEAGPSGIIDNILLREREAVMCHVIDSWCAKLDAEGDSSSSKEVVAVIGAAHLTGIQSMWGSGEWREVVGTADIANSPVLAVPPAPPLSDHDFAVKRGLLEAMFRLSVPEQVIYTMGQVLGPVPAQHEDTYKAVRIIYGSTRMLLATLPPDMLPQICGGFECNMSDVLQPVRAVRPVQGGRGYDWDVVEELQMLYLEIEGEEEDEEEGEGEGERESEQTPQ